MERIGASEASRHLPRLLDRVAQGESLTITRQGKPDCIWSPRPTTTSACTESPPEFPNAVGTSSADP